MLFSMRETYVDRNPKPIPPAPAANSAANVLAEWNAVYDAYNEVACLMLGSMNPELHRQFKNYSPYEMLQELKSMFEKQAGVERFDLIQTFHACKQEEGKLVVAYVLKMKGYVEQLERLGYVLPQDISVGLILNELTSDFARFVRNYNMHNMGKTIGELHKANKKSLKAKGNGKANGNGKDKQVYITKPKNLKPSAKEHPAKDDTCHHCKEVGRWKEGIIWLEDQEDGKELLFEYGAMVFVSVVSIHRLVENGFIQCFTDYGISVSKNDVLYFNAIPRDGKMTRKPFLHRTERATDLLGIIHLMCNVCATLDMFVKTKDARHGLIYDDLTICLILMAIYALQESAPRILNMVQTMKVDKTPYELWKASHLLRCEGPLNGGFCSSYDPNPNSFDDSQNLSDYPPQPQYQTYSCELCGNDAHYGYDCPPQVPFVYNQDPCFNQNFDDFPQTSPMAMDDEELLPFDSLLEEFSGELAHIDLIPPGNNKADLDPEEEIRDRLFLTSDDSMPPGIENDDYDSEGDILFLEELLSNDSPSLPENESFHFDVPSSPRPPAKPPDDGIYFELDTGVFTKVVDDISDNFDN
ncbi:hypothetical protein Tco_1467810 [Tanacetum coccineum]